ncbi:MAG: hypothetical protein CMJ64_01220 [Planctomycetaceae bacterium]|nr:hypothetical protein [Planctomycetaceae bacterium]
MDREELMRLIAQGPIRVRMNNGETFEVPNAEIATVSDISAAVLVRDEDGRLRHRHLALVCICTVEDLRERPDASPD